jgi:hypothetical protein
MVCLFASATALPLVGCAPADKVEDAGSREVTEEITEETTDEATEETMEEPSEEEATSNTTNAG